MMNKAITMPKFEKEAKKRAESKKAPENMKMSVNDKNILTVTIDLNVVDTETLVTGEKSVRVASTLGGIRLKKDGFQNVVLNLNAYIPVDEYVQPEHLKPQPVSSVNKASAVTTTTMSPEDMKLWEEFQAFKKFKAMQEA